MKLVHFSDLHLGVETYGRTDPTTGLNTRLLEFLKALDELVDYAVANDVDLVLFAGDAYKSRQPTPTHQREFATRIRRLLDEGISVFLLAGNHDMAGNPAQATTLDIFGALLPPPPIEPDWSTLTVANTPGLHTVATRSGPVQIVAVPWPTATRYLTATEFLSRMYDEHTAPFDVIVSNLIGQMAERLDPALPAILAGHLELTHSLARPGSEVSMTLGKNPCFAPSALHPELFDYVALGHLHCTAVLDDVGPTPIVYAGSLQPVDFGEEDEEKGFYTIDLRGSPLVPGGVLGARLDDAPAFHPVTIRPFVTIEAAPKAADPTPEVLAAIAKTPVAGAIVRVIVRLSRAQKEVLREGEIRKALAAAHFVACVKTEITDAPRSNRLPEGVRLEQLSPLDVLKVYLEQKDTPPARQEVLLEAAEKLIEACAGSGERSKTDASEG